MRVFRRGWSAKGKASSRQACRCGVLRRSPPCRCCPHSLARDFIPFTVYNRYKLFPGAAFSGPAIVEERESTVIVGEDAEVKVDEFGFLWIDLPGLG